VPVPPWETFQGSDELSRARLGSNPEYPGNLSLTRRRDRLKPPKTAKCPNCGFIAQHHAEPIRPAAGTLLELNGDTFKVAAVAKKLESKDATFGQLKWYAINKKYNQGWAANKYRAIYGVWPRSLSYEIHMRPPCAALASWIKSQNIRWAKGEGRKRRWDDAVVNTGSRRTPGTLMTEDDWKHFR
jgi:hypothetical protein